MTSPTLGSPPCSPLCVAAYARRISMCPLLSHGQQGGAVTDILRMQQWQPPPQEQFFSSLVASFVSRAHCLKEWEKATPSPRAVQREHLSQKIHIPSDFVVAQEASEVESSSRLDFLWPHHLQRCVVA